MVFCGMLVAFLFFPSFRSSTGLLLLCGCYFWIVHTVFNSSLRNVRALEMQIHLIRQQGIDPSTTPVPARVSMFYKFRWFMSLFVFCDLSVTIIVTMLMVRMLWLDVALHQMIDLLFFIGVGWTFRMVSRMIHSITEQLDSHLAFAYLQRIHLLSTTPCPYICDGMVPLSLMVHHCSVTSTHTFTRYLSRKLFIQLLSHSQLTAIAIIPAVRFRSGKSGRRFRLHLPRCCTQRVQPL